MVAGVGSWGGARLLVSLGKREWLDSRLHWKFPSVIVTSVNFLRDHWSFKGWERKTPPTDPETIFSLTGKIYITGGSWIFWGVHSTAHDVSEQRKEPPSCTPFPLVFPILTSFCVPLYQVIESEVFVGRCRVGSAEVTKRSWCWRNNGESFWVPRLPLIWICWRMGNP